MNKIKIFKSLATFIEYTLMFLILLVLLILVAILFLTMLHESKKVQIFLDPIIESLIAPINRIRDIKYKVMFLDQLKKLEFSLIEDEKLHVSLNFRNKKNKWRLSIDCKPEIYLNEDLKLIDSNWSVYNENEEICSKHHNKFINKYLNKKIESYLTEIYGENVLNGFIEKQDLKNYKIRHKISILTNE